jgi:hypothetical protein
VRGPAVYTLANTRSYFRVACVVRVQAWRGPKWEPILQERHYLPSNSTAGHEWLTWLLPCLTRLVAQRPGPGEKLARECAVERLITPAQLGLAYAP